MASSTNRHPVVLLGAAASLITVLSFFGVRAWPGTEPPVPAASTGPATPAAVSFPASSQPPAPTPSRTCACPEPTTPPASPSPVAVSCVIEDRLGPGQVSETVTVQFGSKDWELTVDESDPTDRLSLRFPRAGTYRYALSTESEMSDGDVRQGQGEGSIACRGGQTFQVVGNYDGDPFTVSLSDA